MKKRHLRRKSAIPGRSHADLMFAIVPRVAVCFRDR